MKISILAQALQTSQRAVKASCDRPLSGDTFTPTKFHDAGLMNPKRLQELCRPGAVALAGPSHPSEEWKAQLINYLQVAHQAGYQADKIPAAGFLDLDKEDAGMMSQRQKNHPAPGLFNVVVHGCRPYNVDTMKPSETRNQHPFWDGGEERGSMLTTEQLAEKIDSALKEQKVDSSIPVFLDACNAGTDLKGIVPARDLAKRLNRPVVAAVNSRVFQSVRGPVLQKSGASWAAFFPDGHQETLWKPATPSEWKNMPK
jgi:hypothetical protein